MMECPCCHRRAEARELRRCPECGAYACASCLDGGKCPRCAGRE